MAETSQNSEVETKVESEKAKRYSKPATVTPIRNVVPLPNNLLGIAAHTIRSFNLVAPEGIEVEDLENPALWVNFGGKLLDGSEIRVVASDMTWVAYLFVTYALGSTVRVKVLNSYELEDTSQIDDGDEGRYHIKRSGTRKWCIIDTVDGRAIIEGLVSKTQAYIEREDLLKAMRK